MPHFTDTNNQRWELALSIGLARRIRDQLGVDLLADNPAAEIGRLIDETETLVNALWLLVAAQAESRSLSEEDFAAALGGETLDAACDALLEAIVNFSRRSIREPLRAAMLRIREVERKASEKGTKLIEGPEMEEMIERELDKAIQIPPVDGGSSGNSPESPASTPPD